ncbi:MAG: DUF192 domain-containing protein [Candidatus Berkelbacteria bacterium]|nr:MAG: DUF192 domain-containing protein [Candidatus Berkelbacteria bacterium]QQG51844.1 MAG: DUF192 domain-containing protein [Candidatus Berkelbacteria bacterium]
MNKKILISVVTLLAFGLIFAFLYRAFSGPASFRAYENDARQVQKKVSLVTINNRNYNAEVAKTTEEQALGLSGRDSMPETDAMIFPFSPPQTVPFWMKDMRFALDIVWIANGKVIGVEKNAPPPKIGAQPQDLPNYRPPAPVDYVLELNAGQSQYFNVGDAVTILELNQI